MKKLTIVSGLQLSGATLIVISLLFSNSCRKVDVQNPLLKHFAQVNLVDNNHEYGAPNTDPLQINSWGIAFHPRGIPWVNSQGGHVSAVYNAEGGTLRPPVNIPSPGGPTGGNPTGIVFNGTQDFIISNSTAAAFIFVGVDGILSGWNQAAGDNAAVILDNSATSAYTGLAIGSWDGNNYLYAADFRAGKIVTWNKEFEAVDFPFTDPNIPAGYAPFNIQAVGDWLYVAYAKVGPDGRDEKGDGLGYVSIFKMNGDFVKRFASKGALNAPWGIAKAPGSFFLSIDQGDLSGDKKNWVGDKILIGNFGNGYINVYTEDGVLLGPLMTRGKPIEIDGLWAITFPPATSDIDQNRLYFAAGPDDEQDGLFGYIIKK